MCPSIWSPNLVLEHFLIVPFHQRLGLFFSNREVSTLIMNSNNFSTLIRCYRVHGKLACDNIAKHRMHKRHQLIQLSSKLSNQGFLLDSKQVGMYPNPYMVTNYFSSILIWSWMSSFSNFQAASSTLVAVRTITNNIDEGEGDGWNKKLGPTRSSNQSVGVWGYVITVVVVNVYYI